MSDISQLAEALMNKLERRLLDTTEENLELKVELKVKDEAIVVLRQSWNELMICKNESKAKELKQRAERIERSTATGSQQAKRTKWMSRNTMTPEESAERK